MLPTLGWFTTLTLATCCALNAEAPGSVTIHNQCGHALTVRRPSSGAESPILIQAASDADPALFHRLCSPFPNRSPEAEGPVEYLFKDGDTATFHFEDHGKDLASQLLFWYGDPEQGLVFKGMVIYTLVHQPIPSKAGDLEVLGQLSLVTGPTSRGHTLAPNKSIRVISEREMELH